MENIVNMIEREAHVTGTVACAICEYQWTGVAPVRRRTNSGLECPKCGAMDGYFLMSEPEMRQWLCNVSSIFDGWHSDGTAWSEWDETVRAQIASMHVSIQSLSRKEQR